MKMNSNNNRLIPCCEENRSYISQGKYPNNAALNCNVGTTFSFTQPDNSDGDLTGVIPIASIVLDSSHLCNPLTTIDFSTIIHYKSAEINTIPFKLIFQLSKFSKEGFKIPLKIWTISFSPINDQILDEFINSYKFIYCDNCCFEDCCTYTVELVNGTLAPGDSYVIENTFLRALAVSKTTKKDFPHNDVILKCSESTGVTLTGNVLPVKNPIPISSITIDTKCLCKPTMTIDFSSIISTTGNSFGLLYFQLSKICNKKKLL
jgi:hypothetical protein